MCKLNLENHTRGKLNNIAFAYYSSPGKKESGKLGRLGEIVLESIGFQSTLR